MRDVENAYRLTHRGVLGDDTPAVVADGHFPTAEGTQGGASLDVHGVQGSAVQIGSHGYGTLPSRVVAMATCPTRPNPSD